MTNEQLAEQIVKMDEKFSNMFQRLDEKFTNKFDELDGKINKLDTKMIRGFMDIERNIDEKMEINSRQHAELNDLIERRFQELKRENENRKDETRTLIALSKLNQKEHKEYDQILKANKI